LEELYKGYILEKIMFVPQSINRNVKLLLQKMKVETKPVYIPVDPMPWAIQNECFNNVKKMVEQYGGTRLVGWEIWQTPILVEAEHHAVYKDTNSQLRDITPKRIPVPHILFVENAVDDYDGSIRDNNRLNITGNLIADTYIKLCELVYKIENYRDRKYETAIKLSVNESELLKKIKSLLPHLELFIMQENNPNSECFCNSGKQYYECHGDDIQYLLTTCKKIYEVTPTPACCP
jgi:hypothetical protein